MWVLSRVSWGAEFAVLIGLRWFVTFVLIVVLFMLRICFVVWVGLIGCVVAGFAVDFSYRYACCDCGWVRFSVRCLFGGVYSLL